MFLKPLSKCSSCLPCVFFITFQHVTTISVNYTTFFGDMIFVFWCHKFIFDCFSTFKVNFYAISFAYVFKYLTQSFIVGYRDGISACGFAVWVVVSIVSGSTCFCFHSIYCPHAEIPSLYPTMFIVIMSRDSTHKLHVDG